MTTALTTRVRCAVRDGRWRVARHVPGRGWQTLTDSIAAFADLDPARERARVADWLALDVLGVEAVELYADRAAPGTFDVVVGPPP